VFVPIGAAESPSFFFRRPLSRAKFVKGTETYKWSYSNLFFVVVKRSCLPFRYGRAFFHPSHDLSFQK